MNRAWTRESNAWKMTLSGSLVVPWKIKPLLVSLPKKNEEEEEEEEDEEEEEEEDDAAFTSFQVIPSDETVTL
jgi:hypothetical protein